jgi:hypothetical protein
MTYTLFFSGSALGVASSAAVLFLRLPQITVLGLLAAAAWAVLIVAVALGVHVVRYWLGY